MVKVDGENTNLQVNGSSKSVEELREPMEKDKEVLSRSEWFSLFHDRVRERRRSIGLKDIEDDCTNFPTHLKVDDAIYLMFKDESGFVKASDLLSALTATGIRKYDTRLRDTMKKLREFHAVNGADFDSPDALLLNEKQFKEVIAANIVFIDTVLRHRFVVPEWKDFCNKIESIYELCKNNLDGELCQYIPQLAKNDQSLWAASICTVDGQRFSVGNTSSRFTLQSGFTPFNYAIALNEIGSSVHDLVGQEPSGRHYNDIVLDHRGKPHNPMINAGAMVICSIMKDEMKMADRFDYLFNIYKKMTGGDYVGFGNTAYLSERATGDRNFALAHYLRENKCLGGVKLNEMLELYFQLCSIEIDSDAGSVMAATLANGGVCPLTGEKIFDANCTRDVLSLMYSCGMNNFSGQFSFHVGLPAKSGVSGVILLVVPDVMGVCLYSPLLDHHANSVRGVQFCTELVRRFSFHNYDNTKHTFRKTNVTKRRGDSRAEQIVSVLFSAANGDVSAMRRFQLYREGGLCAQRRYWMEGLDMSLGDYDNRTALHLAAAEGEKECVNFLLKKCNVQYAAKDRWGNTPLDDAIRAGNKEIVEILKKWDQKKKEEPDNKLCGSMDRLADLFHSNSLECDTDDEYENGRASWIRRNMESFTSLKSLQ